MCLEICDGCLACRLQFSQIVVERGLAANIVTCNRPLDLHSQQFFQNIELYLLRYLLSQQRSLA